KIHSVAGVLDPRSGLVGVRPFRSPHHTISDAGLIGGGVIPRPGEVSLAHNGVLFLDELPEFPRNVLEVMRQPLEDGTVSIARAVQLRRSGTSKERIYANAQMAPRQIRQYCELSGDCERLLERAMLQQGLTARAHDRILKVARTIADLEGGSPIEPKHIAEAI